MKTVEEIAREVAKTFEVNAIQYLSDGEVAAYASKLIAAVDAERGKDAVAWMNIHGAVSRLHEHSDDVPLFLSPTIPEGMALVPLIPTEEILDAMCDTSRALPDDGDLVIQYNAIIKAAGVTK